MGAREGALFPDFGQGLAFGGGLEEGAEVVAEDAGEDHDDCDGEEDPVAGRVSVGGCFGGWRVVFTRELDPGGSAVPLGRPLWK